MTPRDEDIRLRLRLGENIRWEFKQIEFSGNRPISPDRGDLADEIIAFANASGGTLLCGVTDDGQIQGMSREQMAALDHLLVAVSTDSIEPSVCIDIQRREVEGSAFLLVGVDKGTSLHEHKGRSLIRVGSAKRQMTADERLRLSQQRAQSRYVWLDEQTVLGTGFDTLDEALWRPLLSAQGAAEPELALARLALLALDESGIQRATVAGLLVCSRHPERWLPGASIMATRYRGTDRSSGQVDAQEITGPLQRQIADAVAFAMRNMRVAARKVPARIDMPQYSDKAIFEAVVNAVVHRDYGIHGSCVRLSMFADRLEIQSPGALPGTLTLESMALRQATRNQAIASLMGRMGVGDIRGSADRRYFMERRGDGVPIIQRETRELSGRPPEYRLGDGAEVMLVIPAAPQDATPTRAVVAVWAEGRPLPGAEVLVLFPNKTWKQAVADENGEAAIELYTTELPMTVFGAAPGHAGCLVREWLPSSGALALELRVTPQGGSVIFSEASGFLPGLKGRLNPIRDTLERTYLYASNIAIQRGKQQPVHFAPGEELLLTDSDGAECLVRVVDVVGRSSLVEYRLPEPD